MSIRQAVPALLALATVLLLVSPSLAQRIAADHPLVDPRGAAVDSMPLFVDSSAVRFLYARDSAFVVVRREMSAGELLRMYHIDYAHIRRQMAAQLGVPELRDTALIPQGTELRITLIPPAFML